MDHIFMKHDVRASRSSINVTRQNGLVVSLDKRNVSYCKRLITGDDFVPAISMKCNISCTKPF